jgi:hypothetical protein
LPSASRLPSIITDEKPRPIAPRQISGLWPLVLVHHQRHVGELLDRGQDQVLDEGLAGVLARPGAGLQDDGRADFGRGLHHRLHLLEVVDVVGRDAVGVLGGVVEQLAHGDEWHVGVLGRLELGDRLQHLVGVEVVQRRLGRLLWRG